MGLTRTSFFFFQAEDGIRDVAVTGVQTCALPIASERPSSQDRSTYACTEKLAISTIGATTIVAANTSRIPARKKRNTTAAEHARLVSKIPTTSGSARNVRLRR